MEVPALGTLDKTKALFQLVVMQIGFKGCFERGSLLPKPSLFSTAMTFLKLAPSVKLQSREGKGPAKGNRT